MDDFLNNRDGLALGISNGFHALIRLGLLPYGEIRPVKGEYSCPDCRKSGKTYSQIC